MSTAHFPSDWLALREPVDHRSRATSLIDPLSRWWRSRTKPRILDLGAGTGSNLRYLQSRMPNEAQWLLLDHDRNLLRLADDGNGRQIGVLQVQGDLARLGPGLVPHADLVTASALLDLVSREWLRALVTECREHGCAVHFALTYDGEIEWTAAGGRDRADRAGEGDALIREAVNAHQRRDKGTGDALGPAAALFAEGLLRAAGYTTWLAPSPWQLGARDLELARALLRGWEHAALEEQPHESRRIREWAARREGTIQEPDFGLTVGHLDLLALPPRAEAK